MRYFLDTEFIEQPITVPVEQGTRKEWHMVHMIQLISIGIVSDTGHEYYAINSGYSTNMASQWVKDNVIAKLEDPALGFHKPMHQIAAELKIFLHEPEIWAYYADYDWVAFCSIFGSMMELPKGYPMYCRDLKQEMDRLFLDKEWKQDKCPDPVGEHNALVDAHWNRQLYFQMHVQQNPELLIK